VTPVIKDSATSSYLGSPEGVWYLEVASWYHLKALSQSTYIALGAVHKGHEISRLQRKLPFIKWEKLAFV
jgi:hypothetical protein